MSDKVTREEAIESISEHFKYMDQYITPKEVLATALDALTSMNQWIPVSERYPDIYSGCIVLRRNQEITRATYIGNSQYKWANNGCIFIDVTHWIPYPDFQEEDENDG